MFYSYLCEECGNEIISETFARLGVPHSQRCPLCGNLLLRSVGKVTIYRGMEMGFQPHFNNTVGQPVTSLRDFKEKLAAKARENTEATGIEHVYVTTDPRDRAAHGIDDEAYEMNQAVNRGVKLDQQAAVEEANDSGGWGTAPPLTGETT